MELSVNSFHAGALFSVFGIPSASDMVSSTCCRHWDAPGPWGYFWKNRHRWDWLQDGGRVMLVSIFAAPYCWLFDHSVAIPALLTGAYLTRSRTLLVLLALASLVIEVGMVLGVKLPSALYLWTAPAWLIWYLFATRFKKEPVGALSEAFE